MTDYNTWLQTVAAISSAIAAIAAVCVARRTLTFYKTLLLKRSVIDKIMILLQQLQYLKSLTTQGVLGGVSDEVITGLDQRISEAKESLRVIESMISNTGNADLKKVLDFVHGLREDNILALDGNTQDVALSRQLDDAIRALQNIYRREVK